MSKRTVREQFGTNAAAYAESAVHARGASLARLVELVSPQPGWRVLDVATGAGHTALALAPHVSTVIASDITPEMLRQAERLAAEKGLRNVKVETADAQALPYPSEHFDLVTCRIAPHHFTDIPLFLREVARVLRPGGSLALVDNIVPAGSAGDYVNAFEKLRDPSHVRCLPVTAWQAAIGSAGLSLTHHELLEKHIDFAFWAKRHDPIVQNYLLALLAEASPDVSSFLRPRFYETAVTFRLAEGLFIAEKADLSQRTS